MAVIRRRLIIWLIKAYIKKSGKTILFSFLAGLIVFFGFFFLSTNYTSLFPVYKKTTIGVVGAYTLDNLPPVVIEKLSRGLTKVEADGSITPNIAHSWESTDNGKTYIFKLHENIYFTNGIPVTSETIRSNYSDVTVEKPNKSTIVYKLKDSYAPFLVTASRPVFDKGLSGVGDYRIEDIKLNGNFVQTLKLVSVSNRFDSVQYQFYPSEEALKMAFLMGEINETQELKDITFKNTSFESYPNTTVEKYTAYSDLVTLFYNTSDKVLSDKKIRLALSYALPESYSRGERSHLPYSPKSLYYNSEILAKTQDFEHAKLLLTSADSASESGQIAPLTIKTLRKYKLTADEIAVAWKQIGIEAKIEEVESVPDSFQIFLGDFKVPHDPDQYALWHSSQIQINNISRYKNVRIDKLLEDGRKTTNQEDRKKIYADFQKYLLDDTPASFLYFPYEYKVARR